MTEGWLITVMAFNSILSLLLAFSIVFLYRQWGAIVLRGAEGISAHHGVKSGLVAPPIAGIDLQSESPLKIQPRRQVLVFATSGCPACQELAPVFRDFALAQDGWPLVYISTNGPNSLPEALISHSKTDTGLQIIVSADESAHDSYEVSVSPFVIVVDDSGKVAAKGLIGGLSDLVELVIRSGDTSMAPLRDGLVAGTLLVDGEGLRRRSETVSRRPTS